MKHILKYYKPYILIMIVSIAFLFGEAMAELTMPSIMSDIINNGILQGNQGYIYKKGLEMIIVAVALVICAVMVSLFSSRVAAKTSRSIRGELFKKVTSFSNTEMEKFGTASLITRSTNDIQQIQMATVMTLRLACFAPVMGVGAMIMAYKTSPSLAWTIGLALLCVLIILGVTFSATMPRFKLVQKMIDKLNLIMNERLTGILVIRAFNTELSEEERFDKANKDYMKLNLFINRMMSFMMPAMMLIMNLTSLLVVWAGARLINAGNLQVGEMLAFIQYGMHVIMSFLFITMMFIMIPRAMVSANRVGEVLSVEATILDPDSGIELALIDENGQRDGKKSTEAGLVEFRNVSFRYPDADEDILSNITFTAKPGRTTAIIGSTGSGKSTVINLIPRFFDVTGGNILVDGVDVRDMMQKELRDRIGYIPQKGMLFSGTIDSNLRYGREDATEDEINEAILVAQADEFIKTMQFGLEEPVAQGGTNVSGGQKQRLSIARALVKKPEIYIFDDSFSALDFKTDAKLREALKGYAASATVIIVAQRINTIKNAEQIIVLDDGQIAGIGTHKELLENCKVYQEIANSQLDKEEL